jgi:nitrous oxide reductase accessory protein NosL
MRLAPSIVLAFALAAAGCDDAAPRAIVEGEDQCARCHMDIAELRFAAQARTSTGRVLIFDSVECLASHVLEHGVESFVALHVTDHEAPGRWVPVDSAQFLLDGEISSPMGGRLAAFAGDAPTARTTGRYAGSLVTWSQVLALAERGDVSGAHRHLAPEAQPHDAAPLGTAGSVHKHAP